MLIQWFVLTNTSCLYAMKKIIDPWCMSLAVLVKKTVVKTGIKLQKYLTFSVNYTTWEGRRNCDLLELDYLNYTSSSILATLQSVAAIFFLHKTNGP